MYKFIFRYLVHKSLEHKTSLAEEKLLDDFMKSEYQQIDQGCSNDDSLLLRNRIWSGIRKRLRSNSLLNIRIVKYAAVLILFLAVGWLMRGNLVRVNSMKRIITANNTDSLILADGSVVYLGPNSSAEYPVAFNGEKRYLSLDSGHAFFKIKHDRLHSFIVQTPFFKARVLGTQFNISLRKSEGLVTLLRGEVQVISQSQQILLVPNQQAVFENGTNHLMKQTVDDRAEGCWFQKEIYLRNVSFEEVAEVLEFKYGSSVHFLTDDLKRIHLTFFVTTKDSLETLLDQIKYITQIDYKLKEGSVLFFRKDKQIYK